MWGKKEKQKYQQLYEKVINKSSENQLDDYEIFQSEREKIITLSKEERNYIELQIKMHIMEMFDKAREDAKSKDKTLGFFRYEDILSNPFIKKYFNIITANGDRNIGKTWSSRRMIRNVISKKRRFMLWRNTEEEVAAQLNSDLSGGGWLNKLNIKFEGSRKSPNLIDMEGNTIGYYRSINTAAKFKSIDFPDVDLIVYEEYPEGNVKDKPTKMIKFISTIQRHNPNLTVLLQANYTNQNDEILQFLGVGNKELTKEDFVIFNWEIGALIINIPMNTYRRPEDKTKDVAQRASLGSFNIWKSQYGGGFSNEEPINIISEKDIRGVEPIFNIYVLDPTRTSSKATYGAYKITFYKTYMNDGTTHTVVRDTVRTNNKPIFIFDYLNKVRYPQAHLIDIEQIEDLIYKWNAGHLKTIDIGTHALITGIFAQGLKTLEQNREKFVYDIENVVE